MQPEISVIIPTHNSSRILDTVLKSVFANEDVKKEVLVVDDLSTDNTVEIARTYPCRIITLKEKAGPSHARNIGAQEAKSEILMFMDSDALIEKDTLKKILRAFKENPTTACVGGVFEKNTKHSSSFGKYRDLQLHYWHQTTAGDASVFILTAGAIKREVFFTVGGFKPEFGKYADIEDYEIGHRISEKHPMKTDNTIRFHHLEHASPLPVLVKKLFRRARMWVPLFLERRTFEKNYATRNRGLAVLCAGLVPAVCCLSFFWPNLLYVAIILLGTFVALDKGFYLFLYREGSLPFLFFASSIHFFLSLVLFSGAVVGGGEVLWQGMRKMTCAS